MAAAGVVNHLILWLLVWLIISRVAGVVNHLLLWVLLMWLIIVVS